MKTSDLRIGIIHSLIGKNDGVSIVIDQTVNAMVKDLKIDLGNIFFLCAHSSPRFNAQTDEVFWHKSETHKRIIQSFNDENPPQALDELIHNEALYAKKIIAEWVDKKYIDLIIAHNTSHPYNFITAVGLGYYIEALREQGIIWPKLMVWWHDSYFEREIFAKPNRIVQKYLKYLPGAYVDGIAFINRQQIELGKKVFAQYNSPMLDTFFEERAVVVPNTSDIPWDWEKADWNSEKHVAPPQDKYNDSLFRDLGLLRAVRKRGFKMEDTVLLLQHTRVVPRKRIEQAIDLAFRLEQRYLDDQLRKCIVVLVSGHSGDEQNRYKQQLTEYYERQLTDSPNGGVLLVFGENVILSHRDIIVDKKYYKFTEVPGVVAAAGGIGTYFSELEGFGNNLLEMISAGLPVVINRYDVYKTEIEHLGFALPSIENEAITDGLVEDAYQLLNNVKTRNKVVRHNLKVLSENLDHKIIADKLKPLIASMFKRILRAQ